MDRKKVISFNDLEVYQRSYRASVSVMKEIVPTLPDSEKYDLRDQVSRSSKAVPRLIAEGYAKRHQRLGFQKYLDDAMSECNETVVSLSQCIDIYPQHINVKKCQELVKEFDIAGRQLFKLAQSWHSFNKPNTLTKQPNRLPNPSPTT